MVCAFISNEYAHASAKKLPAKLKASVDDLSMYRDDTNMVLLSAPLSVMMFALCSAFNSS